MERAFGVLKKKYGFGDFLYWTFLFSVPVICAGMAAWKTSGWLLAGYIFLCLAVVAVIYRFFCTRCPHYGAAGGRTSCVFFWSMPQIFPKRAGRYASADLAATLAAGAVLVLLPLAWLRLHLPLLVAYLLTLAAAGLTLRRFECPRCIHASCPSNCAGREAGKLQE